MISGGYVVCIVLCVFFFKQKTAYEMRISDWSSDVCSSDLCRADRRDFCPIRGARFQSALPKLLTVRPGTQFSHCNIRANDDIEIGRASCRERVCQYE